MKCICSLLATIVIVLCVAGTAHAGTPSDRHEARVFYRVGYWQYDGDFKGNEARLDSFLTAYRELGQGRPVIVTSSASPEGALKWRGPLAQKRADDIVIQLTEGGIPRGDISIAAAEVNWGQLLDSVAAHPELVWYDQLIDVLNHPVNDEEAVKRKLHAIDNNRAWKYLNKHFFPAMRYGWAYFEVPVPEPEPTPEPEPVVEEVVEVVDTIVPLPVVPTDTIVPLPNHYWALKTNMIHDILLVPNIGLEWYVGKGLSVEADYSGAWWGNKYRTHLWRYYGGNIQLSYYFDAQRSVADGYTPFTGWHVGVYGEMASYDFQFGINGYQGKVAGGGGVLGGYTMALNKHFSLEFMLGLGFFGGRYKVCEYMDRHEVWKETRMRRWWGPTRIGVTLTWNLGRGNNNKEEVTLPPPPKPKAPDPAQPVQEDVLPVMQTISLKGGDR